MIFSVTIITAYPEIFPGSLSFSVLGRALRKKLWNLKVIDLREGAVDKHQSVDDKPYGGGAGMVFKPDVIANVLEKCSKNAQIFHMSPRGRLLNHTYAQTVIQHQEIIIICSRFEGIDQRVIDYFNMQEVSLGSFVISSGDLAAQVFIDCCVRLLPGVLGNEESAKFESFSPDNPSLLEHDLYTRPEIWNGIKVPEVLISGNHAKIAEWKRNNGLQKSLQMSDDFSKKSK